MHLVMVLKMLTRKVTTPMMDGTLIYTLLLDVGEMPLMVALFILVDIILQESNTQNLITTIYHGIAREINFVEIATKQLAEKTANIDTM